MEEIYRDWNVSPALETVRTSVSGTLDASYDFCDENEDGPPIIRVDVQEWLETVQQLPTMYLQLTGTVICGMGPAAVQGTMFGYASGEMEDELSFPQQLVCTSTRMFLRRCGQPRHYVRHAGDETEVTIPLLHLTPVRLGKKWKDGPSKNVLKHAGSEHAGEDDADVDTGIQDFVFGCASVGIDLCHASHTTDDNSFEEESD